jgi:hypothetical protein
VVIVVRSEASLMTRRIAWAVGISLILHVAILSQVHFNIAPIPTYDAIHAVINLSTPHTPRLEDIAQNGSLSQTTTISRRNEPRKQETTDAAPLNTPDGKQSISNAGQPGMPAHLDMNALFDQARAYAKAANRTSEPADAMYGDYFGTYDGEDRGDFSFHLDSKGHASGSGHSYSSNVWFVIEGEVSSHGVVRMVGANSAGESNVKGQVTGQIDMQSGKVAGTWFVPGMKRGSFSGQHESAPAL